jgi:CRP/FNR family cyclic AMP-dependent transcriptional regulator
VSSSEEMADRLAQIDLFQGLSPKALRGVVAGGEHQKFAAGDLVTEEGDEVGGLKPFSRQGVFFHLVLDGSGSVRIDGNEVGTLAPGSYFGELSIIDGQPRSADVIAGSDGMTTFAISKWTFEALLEEHPEVAVPMLRVLCARLRAADARSH